jgi:hypothetical protein
MQLVAVRKSRRSTRRVASSVVARKRYTEKPALLALKVEPEFLRQLDEEVLRASNAAGRILTRTDVVKEMLTEAMAARAKRRK